MMTTLDHPMVADYLRRLHDETVRLGVPEGRELETQIREHLTEALGDEPTEVEVHEVLDRLGEPSVLVDEAGGAAPGTPPASQPGRSRGGREAGALILLVAAGLFFWAWPASVLMWVVGLVLLIVADRWSVAEKVWGGLVLSTGWLVPLVVGHMTFAASAISCTTDSAGVETCDGDRGLSTVNVVAIGVVVVWLAVYVWTIVHLARSARRDAAASSPADDAVRRSQGQDPGNA